MSNPWLGLVIMLLSTSVWSSTPCPFDKEEKNFKGSPTEQAKCLLREVKPVADLGPVRNSLPPPLDTLIGEKVTFSKEQFSAYLLRNGIKVKDIGGALSEPLSRTSGPMTKRRGALYFVIHDTSTPNYKRGSFPLNINSENWGYNHLAGWDKGEKSKAHVFVSRTGQSISPVNFHRPWRATKFELKYAERYRNEPEDAMKGLFLHVELVQPRRSDKLDGGGDAIAPDPGFTDVQYKRLSELYLAASVRNGEWLIPAFHTAVDAGLKGGHDDPQRFDLEQWSKIILSLVAQIAESR